MRNLSTIILYFTAISMVGCTSLHEVATEYFKNKDYELAAATYEQILSKTPDDRVAKNGLLKSRRNVIGLDLIDVRQARLSNDFLGAIQKLRAVMASEKEWGVSPIGPAYATQSDESRLLFEWVEKQITQELNSKKYLKARLLLTTYGPTFYEGTIMQRIKSIDQVIASKAQSHCSDLRKLNPGQLLISNLRS